MKYNLKLALLGCLALATTFASCNKDDNDDDNNNAENGEVFENGFKILPKKVVKISEKSSEDDPTVTFYYFDEKGRIYKSDSWEDGVLDETSTDYYTYTDKTIECAYTKNYHSYIEKLEIENGLITKFSETNDNEERMTIFGYSDKGYLSSMKWTSDYSDGIIELTEENGYLVSSHEKFTTKEKSKIETSEYESVFTYDGKLNNLNVDLGFLIYEELYTSFMNMTGKRFQGLPSKLTSTVKETGEIAEYFTYHYTYDGEYVTKIVVYIHEDETHVEEDDIFYMYEIFYE
ncbi:MAG: hypothetical protein II939_02390 [Bacteroidales bacterium]|nr:hypothetical protein [Bacteroidales bacterium]